MSLRTRCLLVSDTDEAALLSKLRPLAAKPSNAVAANARLAKISCTILFLRLQTFNHHKNFQPLTTGWNLNRSYRRPGSRLGKRFIALAGAPQMVQKHRQFAGHGHQGTLLTALASGSRQFQSPALQRRIRSEAAQNVMRRLKQQRTQIAVAGLGDSALRIVIARL